MSEIGEDESMELMGVRLEVKKGGGVIRGGGDGGNEREGEEKRIVRVDE